MPAFGFLMSAGGDMVKGCALALAKPFSVIPGLRSTTGSKTEPVLERNLGEGREEDPILQTNPDEDLMHQQNQEQPTVSLRPFDIETGVGAPVVDAGDDDFRKIANGVGLGLVSISFALILTPVQDTPSHVIVVAFYNASVYLIFVTGCCIFVHSFVNKTVSDDVRLLQKIMMPVAVVFLCIPFVLRTYAVSPARSFLLGLVIFVIFGLLLALMLCVYLLISRYGKHNNNIHPSHIWRSSAAPMISTVRTSGHAKVYISFVSLPC